MSNYLACPNCQKPLHENKRSLACANNHCFDRARQGYFNLLLTNKKKSKQPGDNAAMVEARSAFLQTEAYKPISDAVYQKCAQRLKQNKENALCDIGCGEGYYSASLYEQLQANSYNPNMIGLDISKEAIKRAAKRNQDITWVVASGNDMPIMPYSLDIITCLFTRIMPLSFKSKLSPNGYLIVVTTGADHLIELRELLYDEVKGSKNNIEDTVGEHFVLDNSFEVNYQHQLNSSAAIYELLAMTPHHWRASPSKKEGLLALRELQVTVNVTISIFQPT